eukprot:scaffold317466_cov44-Tisochrysis_lutea.AAC.1
MSYILNEFCSRGCCAWVLHAWVHLCANVAVLCIVQTCTVAVLYTVQRCTIGVLCIMRMCIVAVERAVQ